jgi:hypothetical protein
MIARRGRGGCAKALYIVNGEQRCYDASFVR